MPSPEQSWIEIAPGIPRRTIAAGPTMYQMRGGGHGEPLPEHQHAQEQITHVVNEWMRLIVAGVVHEFGAGESFYGRAMFSKR